MTKRLLVGLFSVLACALPAQAQIPGINLNLGARVGYFTPLSALAETTTGDLKLKPGLGIGASLELDLPLSPVNVRANVEAALGANVEIGGEEVPDSEVDVVAITGDLVFRPLPRIVVFQPYLLAGAGVKRYSFDVGGAEDDRSNFTGHVGAGGDLKVGPIALLAEINDYISSFEDESTGDKKLQNDVFISVGFRIGML
ncbi:MAG TPA: outer membrane beta-barrel protein [Longimicrobiales bacterium]